MIPDCMCVVGRRGGKRVNNKRLYREAGLGLTSEEVLTLHAGEFAPALHVRFCMIVVTLRFSKTVGIPRSTRDKEKKQQKGPPCGGPDR